MKKLRKGALSYEPTKQAWEYLKRFVAWQNLSNMHDSRMLQDDLKTVFEKYL
jgi:hypothetical protein